MTDLSVGEGEAALLTPAVAAAIGGDEPAPDRLTTRGVGPCFGVALAGEDAAALLHADGISDDVVAEVVAGVDRMREAGPEFDTAWLVTNRPGYDLFDGSEARAAAEALEERGFDLETRIGEERSMGGSTLAVSLDGEISQPERPPRRDQSDDRVMDRVDPDAPVLRDRVAEMLGRDESVPTLGPVHVERETSVDREPSRGQHR